MNNRLIALAVLCISFNCDAVRTRKTRSQRASKKNKAALNRNNILEQNKGRFGVPDKGSKRGVCPGGFPILALTSTQIDKESIERLKLLEQAGNASNRDLHAAVRPYYCSNHNCGQRFSRWGHALRHQAKSEENHPCIPCDKVFSRFSDWKRHIGSKKHQKNLTSHISK